MAIQLPQQSSQIQLQKCINRIQSVQIRFYFTLVDILTCIISLMLNTLTVQMRGNQFPFGLLNLEKNKYKKVLIRKRYHYKNISEYTKFKDKVEVLKKLSHKNAINLRSTQDANNSFIDLIYPYVPIQLQESFNQNVNQTVKEMHKQFIELGIHLAKNYILTSFNPSRCGVVINEDKSIIKYYLPLNEIIITNNVGMLQRSVQLFSVQSMHYLDTLCHSTLNSTIQNSQKFSYHKNTVKLVPDSNRIRKVSQPVSLLFNRYRKFSTYPIKSPQLRKLSNLSKQLSQFPEIRRQRTQQLIRVSARSFNSIKNLASEDSQKDFMLRNYVSENKIIKQRVSKLRQRSLDAIKKFAKLRNIMQQYKNLLVLLGQIKY